MTGSIPALGTREPRDTCVQTSPETANSGTPGGEIGLQTWLHDAELAQGAYEAVLVAIFRRSRRAKVGLGATNRMARLPGSSR